MKKLLAFLLIPVMLLFSGCAPVEQAAGILDALADAVLYVIDPPPDLPETAPEVYDHTLDYAFSLLTGEQQRVYDLLYWHLSSHETEFQLFSQTQADLDRAIQAVSADHPELFWYHGDSYTYFEKYGKFYATVTPALICDMQSVPDMDARIREAAAPVLESLEGLDEYGKVKGVYTYLVEHTVYDEAIQTQSLYDVMVCGRGVCAGYARSAQYLLKNLGIMAAYLYNENHAWDLVRIDGKFYHMDATHGDPILEDGSQTLDYDYLNLTTREISVLPDGDISALNLELPVCDSREANYYIREGRYLTSEDESVITELITRALNDGTEILRFRLADRELFDWAVIRYCQGDRVFRILQTMNVYRSGLQYTVNDQLLTVTITLVP